MEIEYRASYARITFYVVPSRDETSLERTNQIIQERAKPRD